MVSASLSKKTFTRPDKLFEKKNNFFANFHKSDLFLNLGRKRLAGLSNCLHVSSGTVLQSWTSWAKSKFFCRSHRLCETLSQLQTKMAGLSIDWMKQFPEFHHVLTSSKKHWVELSHRFLGFDGNVLKENIILNYTLFFSIRLNDFW